MLGDYDALYAGILAAPDADLPRLVLADWLEETGHPASCARAEYIRAAISLERDDPSSDQRLALQTTMNDLRTMFADEWDAFRRAGPGDVTPLYSRGFVGAVSVLGDPDPRTYQALDRFPVDRLILTPRSGAGRCEPVDLPRLRSLDFHAVRGGNPVAAFLENARLPSLRNLHVSNCGLTDGDVVRLLRPLDADTAFARLERLEIAGNPITDRAAHAIAAARLPATLRRLGVEHTRLTNAGREVLFRRFGFEELRPRVGLG